MIIDSHVLICDTTIPGETVTAEEIIESMDKLGIARSVVFNLTPFAQVRGHDYSKANEAVAKEIKKFPDRLIGFARTNPWLGEQSLKDLEYAAKQLNFKGLKLHPTIDWFPANAEILNPLVELTIRLRIPILMHTYEPTKSLPTLVGDLAERYPEAKIIMAHMGGSLYFSQAILALKKNDNLLLNTAGVYQPHMIKTAVDKIGAERVIFGSDFPYGNPKIELAKVEASGIEEKQKKLVLGENMARLIGK